MSETKVIILFIFCVLFINSALLGIIDNSVEHYSFRTESGEAECHLPDNLVKEIAGYQPIVNKIINEITNGQFKGKTWDSLAELTDFFGPRMVCSESLEQAIDYVVDSMKKKGLENVHTENITAPNWIRGYESAELVKPWKKNLKILGLGSTIGTPRGGIIADVVAFESFDEFSKVSDEIIRGKIVVFVPKWDGYENTVQYRGNAASVASKKGAVAALVRSITPFSIGSPHTGHQNYADGIKKIPVAAITVEDAEMILRMYRRGQQISIHLEMSDFNKPDCISRNTIGELQGSKYVNKSVVVVSGHLDSWDVGVGAMDDGGGSMISWKAVEFLKAMNLRPKRTIRAILWSSEEQGMVGAHQYMESHKANEKEEFNFFMESDIGTFAPQGLDFVGNSDASCILKEILKLMKPLNATQYKEPNDGGPDISWWSSRGFPSASLINKNDRYFWYHHSDGDTMNVWGNKELLDKCTALWAAASYVIADLSVNMPKNIKPN